jgi:hypothetical protein
LLRPDGAFTENVGIDKTVEGKGKFLDLLNTRLSEKKGGDGTPPFANVKF